MRIPILIGTWAAILLAAAAAPAEQPADESMPDTLACAQERGDPFGQCSYRLTRDETGETTVTVVFANGFERGLFFQDGQFLKASVTMSGVGTDTEWRLEDGMYMIRVDGQRYEVPESLVSGD